MPRAQTLGRLATQIADTLRGKRKPEYTPHVDTGDFVVVVNAEKVAVTGKKLEQKLYYRHSGYPGGLRSRTLAEQLERRPTEVLRKAVKGMLPRNRLGRAQITKLKIYAGPEHPHEAQMPEPLRRRHTEGQGRVNDIAQYRGTGKRKTSVARVILRPGDGATWINGRPLEDYFPREALRTAAIAPLRDLGARGQVRPSSAPARRRHRRSGRRAASRNCARARRGRPESQGHAQARGFPDP